MMEIDKDAIRQRFAVLDTANVSDVLDDLGIGGQGLAPELVCHSGARLSGWAFTIAGNMTTYDDVADELKLEACQQISVGDITVWGGSATGVCCFGELITLGMKERGAVGALVDGGVRDVHWIREHGFTVFARYRSPVQSIGRWKVSGWQQTVYMPGATTDRVAIRPSDFILGDDDGVIVVPHDNVDEVLVMAERLTDSERRMRQELRDGASLSACLAKYGHV